MFLKRMFFEWVEGHKIVVPGQNIIDTCSNTRCFRHLKAEKLAPEWVKIGLVTAKQHQLGDPIHKEEPSDLLY